VFERRQQPYVRSLAEGIRRASYEAGRQALIGAVVPFFLFYQLRQHVSLTAAILAATVWSVGVVLHTWHTRGRFDILTAGSLAALLVNAAIGIALQDAVVYLALPAIEQAIAVVILLGSVAIRRPLFGLLAAQFTGAPPAITQHDHWRRSFDLVTLVWAAGTAVRIAFRLTLLATVSVDTFLVVFPIGSWTLTALLLLFTFWYPQRALRPLTQATGDR